MEEKIHEANSSCINQIRHNKEENPDIEGIYGYMIEVNSLVNMPMETLEGRIKSLEMEGEIVNKKFVDTDSFYISQKDIFEVILRTTEPHTQSTPEAPPTRATIQV